jgi:transposase InsO family protein
LAQFSRAAWYRPSQARDQSALRLRIRELAHARPRFGYLRIWVLLRREGWPINRKRVRRLYRLEGLQVRMRVECPRARPPGRWILAPSASMTVNLLPGGLGRVPVQGVDNPHDRSVR